MKNLYKDLLFRLSMYEGITTDPPSKHETRESHEEAVFELLSRGLTLEDLPAIHRHLRELTNNFWKKQDYSSGVSGLDPTEALEAPPHKVKS